MSKQAQRLLWVSLAILGIFPEIELTQFSY